MTRWWIGFSTALTLLAAGTGPAAAPPEARVTAARATAAKPAYRLDTVTLGIRHRVFQDFMDVRKVRLRQRFQVGDTDYSATVMEFVPDFAMSLRNGKVVSRSPEPNNPAFRIVVRFKGQPQDTTWALLKMPPHFAAKSMLAFKVARIDFIGRPPIVNTDTSGTATRTGGTR